MIGPAAWTPKWAAIVGLAPEEQKVGLAVLSEPHTRSIAQRGAVGTPRPTRADCRSSRRLGSRVISTCRAWFNHALTGLLPSLVIVLSAISRVHAQGTSAFNNLGNNDSSMYAQGGGLVYLYDPPNAPWPSGWGLLNKDLNFSINVGSSTDIYNRPPDHTWLISDGSASGIAVGGGRFADPSGGVYAIPGVAPGSAAFILLKAWTGDYDRWELAAVTGESIGSVAFWNPTGGAGGPAASLVGMPALTLGGRELIPEPSSLALLSVGAAALLACRRRRV